MVACKIQLRKLWSIEGVEACFPLKHILGVYIERQFQMAVWTLCGTMPHMLDQGTRTCSSCRRDPQEISVCEYGRIARLPSIYVSVFCFCFCYSLVCDVVCCVSLCVVVVVVVVVAVFIGLCFDVPTHKANRLERTTSFVRPSLGLCPLNAIQEDPTVGKEMHTFFRPEIHCHSQEMDCRSNVPICLSFFCNDPVDSLYVLR